MSMSQDTANMIDTLASAAAKLACTPVGEQIEIQIASMLPGATESIAGALRQDNIELQTSGRIMAKNLEILRGKLAEIHQIATSAKGHSGSSPSPRPSLGESLSQIITLAEPIDA